MKIDVTKILDIDQEKRHQFRLVEVPEINFMMCVMKL